MNLMKTVTFLEEKLMKKIKKIKKKTLTS